MIHRLEPNESCVSWELMIKSFTVLNLGTWRLIRYIIHELFTIFQADYLQLLGSVQVVGTWSCVVSWWPPMWIRMVIRRITATPCIGRFVACLGWEKPGKTWWKSDISGTFGGRWNSWNINEMNITGNALAHRRCFGLRFLRFLRS